jgi:hypothetical protein
MTIVLISQNRYSVDSINIIKLVYIFINEIWNSINTINNFDNSQ